MEELTAKINSMDQTLNELKDMKMKKIQKREEEKKKKLASAVAFDAQYLEAKRVKCRTWANTRIVCDVCGKTYSRAHKAQHIKRNHK